MPPLSALNSTRIYHHRSQDSCPAAHVLMVGRPATTTARSLCAGCREHLKALLKAANTFKVNKKIRKTALRMALADKFKAGQILVVDSIHLEKISTRRLFEVLKNLDLDNALIVTEREDENLEKSSRNIKKVKLLRVEGLNVYDILRHEYLLFVEGALGMVEEALAQ